MTTDRQSSAHAVRTDPVLIQEIYNAVEACQVLHETSETRVVDGVLENLVPSGVGWKRGCWVCHSDARTQQGSDERRTLAEKCSKYLHQSNGTSANAVGNIVMTATASDCESPEWLGCQGDSESIAPSQIGYTVRVLSQSERCRDDHNVPVRLGTRRSRAELMLKSETVNPEHVRGEMTKLNPSRGHPRKLPWVARTGMASGLPQRRTTRKQWQRNASTKFTGVPRNPKELERELITGNRWKCISKFTIHRYGETPGSSECLGASSRHDNVPREAFERPNNPNATDVTPVIPSAVEDPSPAGDAASTRQQHSTQLDTSKHIHQAVGVKRRSKVNPMLSLTKRTYGD